MRATPDDIMGMAFFARVVEARSFSDAARALGVSKSAVSSRVARLEDHLGIKLLHRTTRRLALTADGVRFYEHCARVISEADAAAEIAAGASSAPRGTLRVYAAAGLAQGWLAQPIGAFMRRYPDVRLELRLGDRMPDVGAEGFDVAVVLARRLSDSSLVVRKLATSGVAACASPAYLERRGIPFRPQELVHHECLLHWALEGESWHFETDEGPVAMSGVSSLSVDDSRFLREAALRGLGIAMLPDFLVADDLATGRLHAVLGDHQAIEVGVHVLHPHARLTPASVRAFVEHLVAAFERPPWQGLMRRQAAAPAGDGARDRTMTEQDVRRLTAVAAVFEGSDPEGARRLRDVLLRTRALPVADVPRSAITVNSRVRCTDAAGQERELSLVYPWDAGPGRVSLLGDAGASLLGAQVGATVELDGRALTVVGIPYQPEAAGDHHL